MNTEPATSIADHADRRVLLLEVARHPGDRAAGAEPGHEDVDPAVHLSQISGPVVAVVGLVVGAVVVLVREEGARRLGGHAAGPCGCSSRGAPAAACRRPAPAPRPWRAARRASRGWSGAAPPSGSAGRTAWPSSPAPSPCCPRRPRRSRAARAQAPVGQGLLDDVAGDAVLDAPHRVEELELGEGLAGRPGDAKRPSRTSGVQPTASEMRSKTRRSFATAAGF